MAQVVGSVLLFIGTYTGSGSKGIYVLKFDPGTGALTDTGLVAEAVNPAFLALSAKGDFLYSVSETATTGAAKSGAVSAFAVDPGTGALTFLNRQLSNGTSPCHLNLGLDGKALYTANYSSGTVAMLPVLADGRLGEPCSTAQHQGKGPNASRQEGPHAHSITPDPATGDLYACDLGLDQVLVYRGTAATLVAGEPRALATHPGAGPRHLAFHPNGRWLYVVNELDSTVSVFRRPAPTAPFAAAEVQSLSTLPPGATGTNWCADIHVHPNGRFVYASNRGHDSIAVLAVDAADGTLKACGCDSVLGRTPRNFALDGSGKWLLAASQDSDVIKVFAVDPASGRLAHNGQSVSLPKPVCIRFAPPR
jgi:6-phosphogluconolactonase